MAKKFDFYEWLVYKDFPIIYLANFIHSAKSLWGWKYRRAAAEGKRRIKDLRVDGGDVFIALNGPSIAKMPLEKAKGMDMIFVNQGFKLPAYRVVNPKYHFFIDSKLINGVWDIHWIDEILSMHPNIIFVMPASWSQLPILQPYIDKGVNILWINGRHSHGVSGAAFQLCWELGYKRIYFAGYEQTGIAAYILKKSSHFYGADPDEGMHDVRYIMKDLSMNARHLWAAMKSAEYAKQIGVEMINLTEGGIMDMFARQDFNAVFNKASQK